MSIFLVRHGETALNVARVLQPSDTPLNDRGMRQAELLAERLGPIGAQQILCSDLTRAQMTAAPLSKAMGVAISTTPLLQERNFGDLRGRPYAQLTGDPFAPDFAPPNGETWPEFHARTDEAFELVVASRQKLAGNLIVVTHGLVCWAFAKRNLQLLEGLTEATRFDNTSVSIFEAQAPHVTRLLNCTVHLGAAESAARRGGAA